jgi:hypothetical protein
MWIWRVAPDPLGVADDPAHCVAGGHRACADKLLPGLERDVGDLPDGGIDLIKRPLSPRVDLHRVNEAVAHRLDSCRLVCLVDASGRIRRLRGTPRLLHTLQLAGSGSGRGSSTTVTGAGGSTVCTAGAALS